MTVEQHSRNVEVGVSNLVTNALINQLAQANLRIETLEKEIEELKKPAAKEVKTAS